MKGILLRAALCVMAVNPGVLWAEDWGIRLQDVSEPHVRSPDTVFRLYIPPDVSAEVLSRLAVELDGIDATAMIRREGDYAVLPPAQPLSGGEHQLRLVYYAEDGSIEELGDWRFSVPASATASARADISLTASQRFADEALSADAPAAAQLEGAMALRAEAQSGDWQAEFNGELLANTNRDASGRERSLDAGEFLLTARNSNLQLQAGHHNLPYESLIHSDFYRRGLSGSVQMLEGTRLTGFAMRGESITGFRHGLGIDDEDQRVQGVVAEQQLLGHGDDALYLSAGYVSGQAGGAGWSEGNAQEINEGSAWSVAADAYLFSQKLRLRGEYAYSRYDWDGDGYGGIDFDEEGDGARALLVNYDSGQTEQGPAWNLGAEYREVGSYFYSLANTALASDKVMQRLFGAMRWTSLSLDASVGRETSNVEDDDSLPTIETDLHNLSANWTPLLEGEPGWLGQPSYYAGVSNTRQRQTFTPSSYIGDATDNRSWQGMLQASFSYESWSWSLGLNAGGFDDYSNVSDDTRTQSVDLSAGWQISPYLYLGPSLQLMRTRELDARATQISRIVGLNADFTLIPDRLRGNLIASLNRNHRSDDTQDDTTSQFSGELVWQLRQPSENRAGFELALSGSYQDVDDRVYTAYDTEDQYQVFLSLTMTLPAASQ